MGSEDIRSRCNGGGASMGVVFFQVAGHLMMYQRDCEINAVRFGQAAAHRRGHGHSLTTSP
jgi:hypothetical protein